MGVQATKCVGLLRRRNAQDERKSRQWVETLQYPGLTGWKEIERPWKHILGGIE